MSLRWSFVVLVGVLVAAGGVAFGVVRAQEAHAASCGGGELVHWSGGSADAGDVPVLFVHGITGDPSIWQSAERNGGPSLADRVEAIQQNGQKRVMRTWPTERPQSRM